MSFTHQTGDIAAGLSTAGTTTISSGFTSTWGAADTAFTGALWFVAWACNAASVTATINDSEGGNTWVNGGALSGTSLSHGYFYCLGPSFALHATVPVADTIDLTFSTSVTRRAMIGGWWSTTNHTPTLDGTTTNWTSDTSSPMGSASHGALTNADDLGIGTMGWLGGAVASGKAFTSPAGFTSMTGGLSAGTTTRIEANLSYKDNMASAAAWATAWTTTTVTNTHGFCVNFKDGVTAAALRPKQIVVPRIWAGR